MNRQALALGAVAFLLAGAGLVFAVATPDSSGTSTTPHGAEDAPRGKKPRKTTKLDRVDRDAPPARTGAPLAMAPVATPGGAPPAAMRDLPPLPEAMTAELEAFFALSELDPTVPEGDSPRDEDARHMAALAQKSKRLAPLEDHLGSLAKEPELRVAAMLAQARVYEDMGDFLASAPAPSYLTPEQAEVYTESLDAKAQAQYAKAHAMLDSLEATDPSAADAVAAQRAGLENR